MADDTLSGFLGEDLEEEEPEEDEQYEEYPDPEEEELYGETGEEETPERDDRDSRSPSAPPRSGSSARSHQGRNGPRSSASSASGGHDDKDSRDSRPKDSRKGFEGSSDTRSQKRPRGNLPPAPVFDGDRRKDPKCLKKYMNKVDSYVELARKIIDDSEIGLRLHAALEGEAMDYLEDVPAKTFGVPEGWKILLKVLKDKFDETKMSKVGSAMRNFFKLNLNDKQYTLREVADAMDKAARQCRETGLQMPDAIMIYFFFEHAGCSAERQANLLLRTGGKYDWKKIKEAVELLYPNVVVNKSYQNKGYGGGRGRGAHEAHHYEFGYDNVPGPEATSEQIEAWLVDHDPAEAFADNEVVEALPEDVARELHTCFSTHRENRQRLAKAVKNRGFYVSDKGKGKKGKGSGKTKGGGKGKGRKGPSKGGGKARGMSLDELKAVTTCTACGQVGHWHDDAECPKRGAHEASREQEEDDEQEDWQWQEGDWSWADEEWEAWATERYGYPTARYAHTSSRTMTSRTPVPTSSLPSSSSAVAKEAQKVTRDINAVRNKMGQLATVKEEDVKAEIESEQVKKAADRVKKVMNATRKPHVTPSAAPTAVSEAVRHYQTQDFEQVGTAWSLLREDTKGPDIESLRRSHMTTRVVRYYFSDDEEELIPGHGGFVPRSVQLMARRKPTVKPNKTYITIDTACENTVGGSKVLEEIFYKWSGLGIGYEVKHENELYCFGPGAPQPSLRRFALPIGVAGVPMVIQTSMVQDGESTSVPFLAGQDWLLFVGAVIDVGAGKLSLASCGVTTALEVDVTGHLAVAIDDFPLGFKLEGYQVRHEEYAGTIFSPISDKMTSDIREMYTTATCKPALSDSVCQLDQQVKSSPNFHYEPNDDDMNEVNTSGLERGPCIIAPDYWEFRYNDGMFIRHHCRPRRSLFNLEDCTDGPGSHQLDGRRYTVVHGVDEVLLDSWKNHDKQELPVSWVGQTVFTREGFSLPSDIKPVISRAVQVMFPSGKTAFVSPDSVTPSVRKKIQQFDLHASNPMFETPASKRQVTFEIPRQQFGSAVVQQRREPPATSHAKLNRSPQAQGTAGMATVGDGHRSFVDSDVSLAANQPHGERVQASLTSSDGLYGGYDAGRGGDISNHPSVNHNGLGSDSEGSDVKVPQQGGELPSRGSFSSQTGKQSWSFPGVRGLRNGEEGTGSGLPGPNHQREGAGLCNGARLSSATRRKDGQVRHPQGLGWIGRMLLALITASLGVFNPTEAEIPTEAEADTFLQKLLSSSTSDQSELRGRARPEPRELGACGNGDGRGVLNNGHQKRMRHQARKALAMSRLSQAAVHAKMSKSKWPRRKFNYDLIEIFGGTSMISLRGGYAWGLRVMQPIDIRYGVDLRKRVCRRWLMRKLDEWNPRLAVVEFPCTPWSILQKNCNYKHDPDGLAQLQEADRPFLKLTKDIFESQRRRHGHAMAENPATASSHQEPEILYLRQHYFETTSCLCMFGMRGKNGKLMQKRVRFIATHRHLVDAVDRQCDRQHEHEKVEGSNTAASAAYPPDLADAICRAYLELKEEEDFGLKHVWEAFSPRLSYYVDAKRSEELWRPLFPLVEEILARRVQSNVFLDPATELYNKISELVPWQIANIQISHLPKAKRVRPGLEKCHRASILMTNDDNLVIETEYLPDCQAPRERFVTPVRYAIFVLGYAPGEPKDPSPAQPQPVQVVPEAEIVEDPLQLGLAHERLVRQDFAGECWFIGPPLTQEQKKVAPSIVRMHRNLGHPRQEDFTRALAQQDRVEPEVLALSRRLRCATCERTKRPLPPRPTSLKSTPSFNTKLSLDFVFLHDSDGVKFNYLHVLDPAGGFNVFALVDSREPSEVLETFTSCWLNWAGFPEKIRLDRDGGFGGEFDEAMTAANVDVDAIPAEAHWQAGDVEAYNRAFRFVANRIIDEKQTKGRQDMKLLGAMVGSSMNDKVRMSGASPNQWVFGKNPTIPGDLLNMDGKIEMAMGLSRDEQLRHRQQVRSRADALISEYRIQEALQKAVSRQSRPPRTRYEPGELIAFWRNVKRGKGGKLRQPGWIRGTIIGPHRGDQEGQQSNYWVSSNGKCILVSLEQLRPAFGTELWPVQEADLEALQQDVPKHYYDEVGEGPLDEDFRQPHEEMVVPLFESDAEGSIGKESSGPVPTTPEEPHPEEVQHSAVPSAASDGTQPHPESPLAARDTRVPGTPVQMLWEPQAAVVEVEDENIEPPESKRPRIDIDLTEDIELLEGEPARDALVATKPRVPEHEEFAEPTPRVSYAICRALHMDPVGISYAYITRKEVKALEKEIPYHMIPEEQRQGYHDALVKEWDVWQKYQAVKVLDLEASRWVVENIDSSRILDGRVCYRNKNAAFPWLPVKHKARIVCRGDNDPDLTVLRRDAPTLTRLAMMLILQIAASMPGWFMFNSDITGAFLQGDQALSSRKESLYLRQPREGLPGLAKGQIMLVVRGIFGLANSPRLFWRHLRDTLLRIGFRQSTLDRALFCYYKDQRLILVLGAHVDDLLGTGQPGEADHVIEEIKKQFDFGAWADDREDEVLEYGGKEIRRGPDRSVLLSQAKFIRATQVTPIPKWRTSTPNAALMPKELTELRSVGGCLHWLVGQTRPDLAAGTSLYMSGQPTVDNLAQLNKLLKEAKATEEWALKFRPVPLETARIIVFSDASFANAEGLRSQAGYLVFIAGENACSLQGDAASLVDWRSHKIKRQCRSTLAAETMSLDSAVDAGLFARELLAEIMVESYVPCQSGRLPATFLPMTAATDCRSLFDLLVKDGPLAATQEKRLAIDLSGLKETAAEFDEQLERLNDVYKWVDTNTQRADHLTKVKPSHLLRDLLDGGHIALQTIDPKESSESHE